MWNWRFWTLQDSCAIEQTDGHCAALKTRSGKIMRRILRKIAEADFSNLGDTSTLADPAVVDDLVNNRQTKTSA